MEAYVRSKLFSLKKLLTEPASPLPLGVLRILLSLSLLGQAAWISDHAVELYSRQGILQGGLADYLSGMAVPNLGWVQTTLEKYGMVPETTVLAAFWFYVTTLLILLIGWKTRVMAITAWFIHYVVMVSGYVFAYGVDHFANIFLFYFIFMPIGDALSIDSWRRGSLVGPPTAGARLALRVLQFELIVVYVSSGFHKALGEQWWNGEAIWRSVTLPLPRLVEMGWLAHLPWLAVVAGWVTIILEIGYGFGMAYSRTRALWILGIVGLHMGIALGLGLVTFGIVMSVLTISIFGISPSHVSKTRWKPAESPVCGSLSRKRRVGEQFP